MIKTAKPTKRKYKQYEINLERKYRQILRFDTFRTKHKS